MAQVAELEIAQFASHQRSPRGPSIPTVAHLTCVGSTRDELIDILGRYTQILELKASWRYEEIQLVDHVHHGHQLLAD